MFVIGAGEETGEVGPMSGSWPQGLETAAAHAADHVGPDAVGGRVEQPPVGGELLQGAHPGGGAEDGHAVAGLHFLVTSFVNACRTRAVLSNDRPKSSTTSATVRRTSAGRILAGGGAVGAGFAPGGGDMRSLVIFGGFRSCRIWNSAAARSVTGWLLESVTTASTCTRSTFDPDHVRGGQRSLSTGTGSRAISGLHFLPSPE